MYYNFFNLNLDIQFSQSQTFKENSIVQRILNNEDLNTIYLDCLNDITYYPIIFTFIHGTNKKLINDLVAYIVHQINDELLIRYPNNFFSIKYLIKSIIDNEAVEERIKQCLIHKLWNKFTNANYHIAYIWSNILSIIYTDRKTYHIPIDGIKLLFDRFEFEINKENLISNVLLMENFIQFLTKKELNKIIPPMIKKPFFKEWLYRVHIPSYIWLISKIASYLPYSFTVEKLLPLVNYQYNKDDIKYALMNMSHLADKDKIVLQAYFCLKDLN